MPQLNLKPNHKAIRDYYATLQQYEQHDITHEGAVSNPFAFLLDACAKQVDATLVPQYPNLADQLQYIVNLIARVITVSLKTVEVVGKLPAL